MRLISEMQGWIVNYYHVILAQKVYSKVEIEPKDEVATIELRKRMALSLLGILITVPLNLTSAVNNLG